LRRIDSGREWHSTSSFQERLQLSDTVEMRMFMWELQQQQQQGSIAVDEDTDSEEEPPSPPDSSADDKEVALEAIT
jgi:hypothetical protein